MIMVYYIPILKMNPYTVRTTAPGFLKICLFISWKVEKKYRKSEKMNLFPCFFWKERVYFHLLIIC